MLGPPAYLERLPDPLAGFGAYIPYLTFSSIQPLTMGIRKVTPLKGSDLLKVMVSQ